MGIIHGCCVGSLMTAQEDHQGGKADHYNNRNNALPPNLAGTRFSGLGHYRDELFVDLEIDWDTDIQCCISYNSPFSQSAVRDGRDFLAAQAFTCGLAQKVKGA